SITPLKKQKKSGREYVYYHCSEYKGKHDAPYVREEELTEQFAKYFDQIHIPENVVKGILETLKSTQQGKKEYYENVYKGLTAEYEKLEMRIDRMYEDKLDGIITSEEFKERSTKYRIEQKAIEGKLNNLRRTDEEYFLNANYLLNLANKAPQIFKSSKVEVKRQLIKLVLWNPTLNDVTLSASIRKPFSCFTEEPSVPYGSPNRI
ncbi:MAG: hypothetical protein HQL13_06795, partial [Candidatus Omnitrophica bacterium]|nr:hypothetical protein [Candidatus Omnitrophota bacterium]